jgi:hypothetical protein
MRIITLFIILTFAFTGFALAKSAISCHCFQDREYEPQRADAADPYFLATTQNSLLAKLFGLSKRDVVRAKMGGADGDSLWVGHYLAQKSGRPIVEVDALFTQKDGWRGVVQQLQISPQQLTPRFLTALDDQKQLAMVVVDAQLLGNLKLTPLQLQRLREQGADNHLAIMAVFISQAGTQEPAELFTRVAAGQTSWGRLLAEQKLLNGADIMRRWDRLLEKKVSGLTN